MGTVGIGCYLVSVYLGAFLGTFSLCLIVFIRGVPEFSLHYDYQRGLHCNWRYKGCTEVVS